MPYGYLGTAPNQIKSNSGVFSVDDISELKAGWRRIFPLNIGLV